MKLPKYYSLDECREPEKVYRILNDLQEDLKIDYEEVDTDIIKIRDTGLNLMDIKSLMTKLTKLDVIEYTDIEDDDEEEEDWDDESHEEDYYG